MEPVNEEPGSVPRPQPVPSAQPSTASSNVPDAKPPLATSFSNSPNVRNSTPRSPSRSVSSCDRPVSGVIPPYWQHTRNTSRTSQISREGGPPITLEDHTEDPNSDTSRGLWARSVTIDDHVVVHGKTGIGAYVVWYCVVQTLDVRQTFALVTDLYAPGSNGLLGWPYDDSHEVYSEFDDLRQRLRASFPHATSALPPLPPKSILFRFRSAFLESRRVGLEYFLNCVLLNPEFAGSPIVKDFLFGRIS